MRLDERYGRAVKEKAFAKINISLDVTKRRPDGYHDMVMVMQTISLCDELTLTLNDSGRVNARTNMSFLPCDEQNLAVKAAKCFLQAVEDPKSGADILLRKQIPVGAGLAGGSADAAAVLRAMNRLYGDPFDTVQLCRLGEKVGSDVPFCAVGGTKLARGRGEILSALPDFPDCCFTVIKPAFSISTPELFRRLDSADSRCHPDTAGILQALERKDLRQICRRMYNVFEDVGDRRMKTVAQIKDSLLDYGAIGAVMTGTGSAVFGVFTDPEKAAAAADAMKDRYKFACVAEPIGSLLPFLPAEEQKTN